MTESWDFTGMFFEQCWKERLFLRPETLWPLSLTVFIWHFPKSKIFFVFLCPSSIHLACIFSKTDWFFQIVEKFLKSSHISNGFSHSFSLIFPCFQPPFFSSVYEFGLYYRTNLRTHHASVRRHDQGMRLPRTGMAGRGRGRCRVPQQPHPALQQLHHQAFHYETNHKKEQKPNSLPRYVLCRGQTSSVFLLKSLVTQQRSLDHFSKVPRWDAFTPFLNTIS